MISDDVVEKQFVCDLSKCKGGCCEVGDAGAPLTEEELTTIGEVYEKIKPYLLAPAILEIERKGKIVFNPEFGWVTPTLGSDKEICVYGRKDKDGIIKCAFEEAYNNGEISWKKPISCHLYPIVVRKGTQGDYDRVNYEPREILCSPGCELGKKLKMPVYVFLKEALIRKYGEEFFNTLDISAKLHQASMENEESKK